MFPDLLVRSSVMVHSGMWVRPLWWEALKSVPPKTITASTRLPAVRLLLICVNDRGMLACDFK
jgi:hypothetical protein